MSQSVGTTCDIIIHLVLVFSSVLMCVHPYKDMYVDD